MCARNHEGAWSRPSHGLTRRAASIGGKVFKNSSTNCQEGPPSGSYAPPRRLSAHEAQIAAPERGDAIVTWSKLGLWAIRTNQFQGHVIRLLKRTALSRLVILATLLVVGHVYGWPSLEAQAQQAQQHIKPGSLNTYRIPRSPVGGGYSMTLSDVWGPPEMPPIPKDFGPHFDFPPESLNGPPLHDPSELAFASIPVVATSNR